jgi:molecular chaperone DnaK
MANDNREIGRFILDGLPPAPRGMPQVEVTFDIDANGILSVNAKDKATSKEQSIRIEGTGGLSNDEIDRMVHDAEAHAADDKQRREVIEKHNALDSLIYQAEKQLGETADKLEPADKTSVEEAIAAAKQKLESQDPAELEAATQTLTQALHKVAEALYQQEAAQGAGAPGADAPGGTGGGGDDDVIDADYTEEKRDS